MLDLGFIKIYTRKEDRKKLRDKYKSGRPE